MPYTKVGFGGSWGGGGGGARTPIIHVRLFVIAILSSIDTFVIIEMRVAALALYKWHFDSMGDC